MTRRLSPTPSAVRAAVLAALAGVGSSPSVLAGQEGVAVCGEGAREGARVVPGRVVDRQTRVPLAGATVELRAGDAGDSEVALHATTSGEAGTFRSCVPVGDGLELTATFGGRTSDPERVGRDRGGPVALEIDLGTPVYVVVSVDDAQTGHPVDGVAVRLEPLPLGGISNASGRVELGRIPPGRYRLRADHIAFAPVDDEITLEEGRASELHVPLTPRVLAVEPIRVQVTGRDPLLVNVGFYDRMEALPDAHFYSYWDVEPYHKLSTFFQFNRVMFIYGRGRVFINGRPMERIGYESVDELPFGKIRGIERMRCSQMPLDVMHYVDAFEVDCFGVMIWVGERRVRSERPPPPDR